MGLTKTEHFSDEQNELANIAKALGHPARMAIMDYLLKVNACICGDIVDELPLAQPTISQHLKELKNAGLIKGTVEGKSICYCIDTEGVRKLSVYFAKFLNRNPKEDCCKPTKRQINETKIKIS